MEDKLKVREHFNAIAKDYDFWKKKNWYYYAHLKDLYRKNIPPHKKVLELGCGTGEILNCVQPSQGIGVDISEEMVTIAQKKFPSLKFIACPAEELKNLNEEFEYVIMCDLLDHVSDIWGLFKNLEFITSENTRIAITTVNPVWDPILNLLERWKLKMPEGPHNFIFSPDIINLLKLFGYEIEQQDLSLLLPAYIPFLSKCINSYLCYVPLIRNFSLVQSIIAKKVTPRKTKDDLSCSVVIPCFNEADNVAECARRIPAMGRFTEVIFVDDGSQDGTADKVRDLMKSDPRIKLIAYSPNKGKTYAIQAGFDKAAGDALMILDADMAVMPEDLEKFFWAMGIPGVGFVNGTRMVYPMEDQAMRGLNLFGNKIFGLIFTLLLGQRITDTLCGTKAISKEAYQKINMTTYDKWGDFDLLLDAAKLGLRIVEMPVRYKRRLKGESKMQPFKHGFQLLLRCFIGFKELKLSKLAGFFKKSEKPPNGNSGVSRYS